ncbi:MAG: hypothetical protein ETSY1_30320 [Candidatus Entotheonella factor]|uniref:PBP domain-containing protein n=1 Tax=Entotheonella factor TaxID=1429438 RepID=W4LC67_ENTF1|nr:MAG: hypothetical protein ETSY1_30320 [Candidatus Entotheonella factor]
MPSWISTGLLILMIIVVSCATVRSDVTLPLLDPLEVKGNLRVAGSATVVPLIRRMYKRFILEGYRGVMNIRGVGTGRGFKLFCQEGQLDIVLASRPVKGKEVSACAERGLAPVEFVIGVDMLTIVANIENDFFRGANLVDLKTIFTANRWSEVNEEWPDDPIERYVPEPGHGSFDFFIDAIFRGDADALLIAANTVKERDPESIAQSVGSGLNRIGVVGYAFYKKYRENLTTVAIDLVKPSSLAAERGDYPLTRQLFVYSDSTLIREKEQVRAFLSFLLNYVSEEIEKVGYFRASQAIINNSKLVFLDAMGIEP